MVTPNKKIFYYRRAPDGNNTSKEGLTSISDYDRKGTIYNIGGYKGL